MTIDFDTLDMQVRQGLPANGNDLLRMEQARANSSYYNGDFEEYRFRLPPNRADDKRSTRSILLTQKITNALTEHLYRASPSRTVKGNPAATDFLQKTYKQNAMFAKWLSADRQSLLNQVAAFQVGCTGDPNKPIKIVLWDASQFLVWTDPDDCTCPVAVLTVFDDGNLKHYTLWTNDTVAKYTKVTTEGMTGIKPDGPPVPNPYGMLPFSFVHFHYPVCEFWSGGIGTTLREANDNINTLLTYLSDDVRYNLWPKLVGEGLDPQWEPNKPYLSGDVIMLSSDTGIQGDSTKVESKLYFLQNDPEYVAKAWDDIQNYLNMTLEMAGIPEASVRMVQSVARSGLSIASEQIPLINWSKSRQPFFAHYEEQLAKLVFQIGVKCGELGYQGIPADLTAALDDFQMSLRWADMVSDIPGPGRNQEDEWLLRMGLTSKLQILMKRNSFTRDEAMKALKEVARDNEDEEAILPGLSGLPDQQSLPGDGSDGDQISPAPDDDATNPA